MRERPLSALSRKQFLGAAAGAGALALHPSAAWSAGSTKYLRRNLSDPNFPVSVLESYKKAIRAMLNLPPTDPRNWYRNAFTHTLDCPHGNWWFVIWHRGYIGWFERICRDLSGDPTFALPYWDWTAQPRIPDAFFDDVLNPADPAYIASFNEFYAQFQIPMQQYWDKMSTAQLHELKLRGYNSMDDVWAQVKGNPMFFPPDQARALTRANPDFDATTQKAVSLPTIQSALAPQTFIDFGSPVAPYHSETVGFGILEGQPHNNVHNNVGGFMQDFLSPVDPLFFMHHSNIDRLWYVWTHKQLGLRLPIYPTGQDYTKWVNEPFLFFVNEKGTSATGKRAGDYKTTAAFDYTYQPGSAQPVAQAAQLVRSEARPQAFAASLNATALTFAQTTTATVSLPQELTAASSTENGRTLYARITLNPPDRTLGLRFNVLLNAPEGSIINPHSPYYVGTLEFFGNMHHMEGPVFFTLPISHVIAAQIAAKHLTPGEPLRLQIVPESDAVQAHALTASLVNVTIGTF